MVDDETLLLDLLNSTPTVDGGQQDALGTAAGAHEWLRAHGGSGSTAEARALREARTALQGIVRGEQSVDALAPLLTGVAKRPLAAGAGIDWTVDVPGVRAISVRAILAWDALHRGLPNRLRPCANPDCTLFLIDHSKPNKARWCSMAVCGNRMKARRHYERSRGNAGH